MKTIAEKVLENVERIRNAKGYTQDYMASKLGLKQSGYSLIMRGERGLQFDFLEQIAIILEMDIVNIIKYPDVYDKIGTQTKISKVLVELDISEDEIIKLRLKDKVLKILDK